MFYIRALFQNTWYYLCLDGENVPFMYPRPDTARSFNSKESAEHWMHEVAALPLCRHYDLQLALG